MTRLLSSLRCRWRGHIAPYAGYFGVLRESAPAIGIRWRSAVNSNSQATSLIFRRHVLRKFFDRRPVGYGPEGLDVCSESSNVCVSPV
jgi:hypothetical protein